MLEWGVVKFFHEERGFGMITTASGEDLFFHVRQTQWSRAFVPRPQASVQYDTAMDAVRQKPIATRVTVDEAQLAPATPKGKGGKGNSHNQAPDPNSKRQQKLAHKGAGRNSGQPPKVWRPWGQKRKS